MKQILIYTAFLVIASQLHAQNSTDIILKTIEKNNTTLLALRKKADAQKIGNKTGIYIQNPELEFNYLWGNPSSIGNRTDFSLKQSFDFPTAYKFKNQLSDIKNEQSELEYDQQRKQVLFETRMVCIQLTHQNALIAELNKRLNNATQIAKAYKIRFDIGDANILEFNKSQVNLLNISKELETNVIERNDLLAQLTRLNGGITLTFEDSVFAQPDIIADFDQWYAQAEQNNAMLQWIKKEIAISQKQVQLNKALSLPKFNAGYMSETVVGEQFRGLSVGISIPLWENNNTVKYAKVNTLAMQSMETDTKLQFYNQMKASHTKAISLQNSVTDYRKNIVVYNNAELARKALDKGEISLSEYIVELSIYYESYNKLLEMELMQSKVIAELKRY